MKILNIKMNNYGSCVGDHFISLVDRGLVLIQGVNKDEPKMNSNGAGKSHIPDSLDWCINGKIPRKDHIDSVINDGCATCSVEVQIESDEGDMILIKRSKKRGESTVLKLVVNNDDITKLDVKETQKEIYKLLGIDFDIFHSVIVLAQNDLVRYADSTDENRMDILTKLLQLEFIDDLLIIVKRKQNELLSSEQNILGQKQNIESVLTDLKSKDWDHLIKDWETTRDNIIVGLNVKINESIAFYNSISVEDSKIYYSKIDELNRDLKLIEYPKDTEEYRNLLEEISNIKKDIGIIQNDLNKVYSEINGLQTKLSVGNYYCDKCGQLVAIDHLNLELSKALQRRKELDSHLNLLQNNYNEVDNRRIFEETKLETIHQEVSNKSLLINADLQKYRNLISEIEEKNRKKKSIEEDISRLRISLQEESNRLNPWIVSKQEADNSILKYENDLVSLEQQLNSIYTLKECYSFWINAFGSKGLKSYILDSKLQELNDSINYWINLLVGGTIWVQLVSHKKGRSKKVINSPDIKVCRWSTDGSIISRNYRSWSGGEKQRISLAIDFGLSSIMSRRSNKKYNLIILDEVFKHLDQGGKESVMEMLKLLATEKESLFVVEHDNDFQSLFENRITVIKENGQSRIVDGGIYEHQERNEKTANILSSRGFTRRQPIRNPI